MAHTVEKTEHDNLVILHIQGDLEKPDLLCDEELGLNRGVPMYILVDVSEMDIGLPGNFMEGERQSFAVNPNARHIAVYSKSTLLNVAARMVAKLTRQQEKISIHPQYDDALKHLLSLTLKSGGQSSS